MPYVGLCQVCLNTLETSEFSWFSKLDSSAELLYFLRLLRTLLSERIGMTRTYVPKVNEVAKKWYVVDADSQVVGRLASRVATILMGKSKPCYVDFIDTGDFVVVVNADKVKLTGKKWEKKTYYSHSGYPGGLREITAKELLKKHPERLFRMAVRGMLPKNKLGRKMLKKLKIYASADHPHQAQKPEPLTL